MAFSAARTYVIMAEEVAWFLPLAEHGAINHVVPCSAGDKVIEQEGRAVRGEVGCIDRDPCTAHCDDRRLGVHDRAASHHEPAWRHIAWLHAHSMYRVAYKAGHHVQAAAFTDDDSCVAPRCTPARCHLTMSELPVSRGSPVPRIPTASYHDCRITVVRHLQSLHGAAGAAGGVVQLQAPAAQMDIESTERHWPRAAYDPL